MKINRKTAVWCAGLAALGLVLASAGQNEKPMVKEKDNTYVVDTSKLSVKARGYAGATPVKVYIKNDVVQKVEFLPNRETPDFFAVLKGKFQETWNGKKTGEAIKCVPDGYSGATFSARSVNENVKAALEYYQKNRK